MNVTVRFAVLNEVRIFEPFPIRNGGRTYFVELSGNRVSEVGVHFADVPADSAPTIKPVEKGRVKAEISDGRAGEFILLAERDIRAWQSLLAPVAFVRIDFDSPKIKFARSKGEPERPGELYSFATSMDERAVHGLEDYSIAGRAFCAIDTGVPLIEVMSFFIRGDGDLITGRYVDAYNNFFLFVETQFLRSSDTKKAVAALRASAKFMAALQAAVDGVGKNRQRKPMIFDDALRSWPADPAPLVREIVLLRGKLRHHSLRHQERWDPTKRGVFEEEAHFLARVAQAIAFPETVNVFFNEPYQGRFLAMADELHQTISVHVRITARFNDQIQDVALNMKFPQRSPSLQLAREVLDRSLSTFDEKSPGAQLIALRATIGTTGVELLRFDVGGSLPR